MKYDARLADPVLLLLAGKRLVHKQSLPPEEAWWEGAGLSHVLAAATRLGLYPRDPWQPTTDLVEPTTGLGKLLAKARQWRAQHEQT